jgi:lipoprotein-releasing system permease protein
MSLRVLGFEAGLAMRYLLRPRQEGPVAAVTLLCTGGVTVGVAALVLALAVSAGTQASLKRQLLRSNPHVVVQPGWGDPPFLADDAEALVERLLGRGDVTGAAPVTYEWVLLRSRLRSQGQPARLKGVDPPREDGVTGLAGQTTRAAWAALRVAPPQPAAHATDADDEPLSAEDLDVPALAPVLIGEGLALELGVVPGETVDVVMPRAALSPVGVMPSTRALRVVGLLRTGVHEYDQSTAVVPLWAGLAGAGRIDGIELAIRDPFASRAVAAALAADLGQDVRVTDWTTTFSRLFAAFRWERLVMAIALGLIGVVAGFNIFTILSMNVMARVGDIGILSAMGARPLSVMRVFGWMGVMLGGLGTVLGTAGGVVLAVLADRHRLIELDPSVYLVSHVALQVVPGDVALVGVGMLAVSFLATVLPARAAARLDPVAALRNA